MKKHTTAHVWWITRIKRCVYQLSWAFSVSSNNIQHQIHFSATCCLIAVHWQLFKSLQSEYNCYEGTSFNLRLIWLSGLGLFLDCSGEQRRDNHQLEEWVMKRWSEQIGHKLRENEAGRRGPDLIGLKVKVQCCVVVNTPPCSCVDVTCVGEVGSSR